MTVVSVIKELGAKGAKDRATLAELVYAELKKRGITTNTRGKQIIPSRVLTLLNAMCRDIKQPRKGWWSGYKVVEDDKSFKMLPK